MVAHHEVPRNISQSFRNVVSYFDKRLNCFIPIQLIEIVSYGIATPYNKVWLNFVVYKFQHAVHRSHW